MMFRSIALLLFATAALVGCASGYESFYRADTSATSEIIASRRAAPAPETPLVERGVPTNPELILASYAKRGYVLIGSSSFNSGQRESEDSAVKQGRRVGADLVLVLNPQYTGSVTTNLPITTPTSQTSYTNSTATAYGPAGTATAYGSSTTTTYGTKTSYIPMTVHRSDYAAAYFVRLKYKIGVFARDLDDAERQEYETNRGAIVRLIVDNSPAFNADLLPGDYIHSISGQRVASAADYMRIAETVSGAAPFVVIRNGEERTLSVSVVD